MILGLASVAGVHPHVGERPSSVAYNASKGAMISMTRALVAEWDSRNIRFNALALSFFPSKMTAATIDRFGKEFLRLTPLGRLGGEHDLMGAALLLASSAGRHITGQVLAVDGGMTII